jgi:hypothetical protein
MSRPSEFLLLPCFLFFPGIPTSLFNCIYCVFRNETQWKRRTLRTTIKSGSILLVFSKVNIVQIDTFTGKIYSWLTLQECLDRLDFGQAFEGSLLQSIVDESICQSNQSLMFDIFFWPLLNGNWKMNGKSNHLSEDGDVLRCCCESDSIKGLTLEFEGDSIFQRLSSLHKSTKPIE